jgi:UDP-4-amino-4,6-dideoxy-N-acetyl-beta-L-altrosamine transaminase
MKPIPYARQTIDEEDVAAVSAALRSDWLTQGPAVERFERSVAAHCAVPHAVALCNGTAALQVCYQALGLGSGDLLWTSPVTFVATANAALMCGAEVDFVDIDALSCNMSVDALASKLATAAGQGRLPKIVVPVHLGGEPCDMKEIAQLATRYGFRVVEDAAHAIGARYADAAIGACVHSDATIFSFHPVKIITTAEGGMVTTRSTPLYDRIRLLSSHGTTRDPARMTAPPHGAWYYEQLELGYNYRMTDLQAALGASQMTRLSAFVAKRRRIAERYDRILASLPLVLPRRLADRESALHLYVIRLDASRTRVGRKHVFDALRTAGVGVQVHYLPVHLQPFYARRGFMPGDFPQAEAYYAAAISLPLYPELESADQDRVVSVLADALA